MNLDYLKECRLRKRYTQQSIADEVNISKGMYYSIESGKRVGNIMVIAYICKVLDMDANILLGLKERN